jgi:site-specific DNA recombinase
MTRVALYARYSSDNQRDASIEDQLRLCSEYAQKQGWTVVDTYFDRAVSGDSLLRDGILEVLRDALKHGFDVVLAEALDRISRDQEDVAAVFKRLRFASVKLVTVAEGDISELHIGLKGALNALFLKDLAAKTHRGIRGRVEAGKNAGGNCFGYRVVKMSNTSGEPIRGEREIVEAEANIIRRVFREFAAGRSPRRIALDLNRAGIPDRMADCGLNPPCAAIAVWAPVSSTTNSISAASSGTGSAASRTRRPAGASCARTPDPNGSGSTRRSFVSSMTRCGLRRRSGRPR